MTPPGQAFDPWPLRQSLALHADSSVPFARQELLDGLSATRRFRVVRHDAGGVLQAANTPALREGQALLRRIYGDRVQFGDPTVHVYRDGASGALMAPVFFVRMDLPRRAAQPVVDRLRAAGACIQELEHARSRAVLRLEAAASTWLRLERDLVGLAGEDAQCLAWLVRYEPQGPPERSAP